MLKVRRVSGLTFHAVLMPLGIEANLSVGGGSCRTEYRPWEGWGQRHLCTPPSKLTSRNVRKAKLILVDTGCTSGWQFIKWTSDGEKVKTIV